MQASNYKENKLRWYPNKLRWYPQQPQRFIFTNLSETCCETKRWKPFEPVGTWPGPAPKIPPKPSPGPSLRATFSGTRWTWLGFAPRLPKSFSEPSPEPCWTWPGSAPKPPGTFSGTFSGTLLNLTWRLPDLLRNLLRNLVEPVEPDLALHPISGTLLNLTCLCTKSQTLSGTFGTFSGTSLNLTWCLHQCTPELYSGLKTPSAYAVGEKLWTSALIHVG